MSISPIKERQTIMYKLQKWNYVKHLLIELTNENMQSKMLM